MAGEGSVEQYDFSIFFFFWDVYTELYSKWTWFLSYLKLQSLTCRMDIQPVAHRVIVSISTYWMLDKETNFAGLEKEAWHKQNKEWKSSNRKGRASVIVMIDFPLPYIFGSNYSRGHMEMAIKCH